MEMETKKLTEYERKRIENIKRNDEMLASLNVKSKLDLLSKRKRLETKPKPRPKPETPIVTRRSLRTQGKAPVSSPNMFPRKSISMRDANTCSESDEPLVNKILSICKEKDDDSEKQCRVRASIDLESMELLPENVARVVPSKMVSLKFFPSPDMRMVVVGNRNGVLGFWDVNSDNDNDGIYMYHPHQDAISAILIHPYSLSKIITSCHEGHVQSLDIEKERFGLVCSTEDAIFSMSQKPDDVKSFYLGEGNGVVSIWDERSARSSFSRELHDSRINSIDFNSQDTNMMATSSSDGTACIWDLRKLCKSKSEPQFLKVTTHERAVHSAYFSPSRGFLATTSFDAKIRVLSGPNYEDEFMINLSNEAATSHSSFKGVWGWDDSYIFVGNMKRGVDVISTEQKRLVTTLESPHLTAIPCRFDPHPFNPGMLAGAAIGGQVFIWN